VYRPAQLVPISTSAVIQSSGSYSNVVCGTGTWQGTGTIDYANPLVADATMAYTVEWRKFVGVMRITTVNGAASGTGSGMFTLTPLVGNCVTTDMAAAELNGSLAYEDGGPLVSRAG
jgi:hypothetical protein